MTSRGTFHRRAAALLLLAPLTLPGCAGDDGQDDGETDDDPSVSGMMLEVESGLVPTRLRGTALGGNATGVNGCPEGGYEHYEEVVDPDDPQLHLIGLHEPSRDEDGATRPVEVHVTRPGSSILVLSASVPTAWHVTTEPGAAVDEVILDGNAGQTAVVPDGVPIERNFGEDAVRYTAYQWPSFQATDMADAYEALTGRTMTSFRGCYFSSGFQIDEPDEIRPPHPESRATEPTPVPGCEAVAEESTHCLVNTAPLAMVGLESGTVCRGSAVAGFSNSYGMSIGWQGDHVYGCDIDRGIVRVSIVDGTMDIAPVLCRSITSYDGGLLGIIEPNEGYELSRLMQFATFEAAARREPTHVFGLDPYTERVAVLGDRAYFAWHSTDTVQTAELTDGAPIDDIRLEGYSDWIEGLEATADGRVIVATPRPDASLAFFDATTGERESRLSLGLDVFESVSGLKCYSRAD